MPKALITPVGEFHWAFIGAGSYQNNEFDDSKPEKNVKTITLHLQKDSTACKNLTEMLDKIWADAVDEKRLKKSTKPSSPIYKELEDDDGDLTGIIAFRFKTNAFYKEKEVKIPIYNAQGIEVSLGNENIGNGSRGAVHFTTNVYEFGGKYGLSLYLAAVQLTKFVAYKQVDIETSSIEDEEGDNFTGNEVNDSPYEEAEGTDTKIL